MIKLHCKVQTYHWGRKGLDTLVGKAYLSSVPSLPESSELVDQANNDTYAELWIGDHPNAPAEIIVTHDLYPIIEDKEFIHTHHGKEIVINELFKLNPAKFMGKPHLERVASKDDSLQSQMAFLFKLLAVEKALSIQAHPNKSLAEKLHQSHPDIYKDDNHKPEMAIALDDEAVACIGFLSAEALRKNLESNRVLKELFECNSDTIVDSAYLRKCVSKIFLDLDKDHESLQSIILKLVADIRTVPDQDRSPHQKLTLSLLDQYGSKDVGLLFIQFMNVLTLNQFEAIFIKPDVPHAYIQGDLVECMINSDNVVRGGLTPKFKDTETFIKMLPYEQMSDFETSKGSEVVCNDRVQLVEYKTGYEEFRVFRLHVKQRESGVKLKFPSFSMAVVIKGNGKCKVEGFEGQVWEMQESGAYYVMPEREFEIISESDEMLLFIAN